jgi:hypothetical protein
MMLSRKRYLKTHSELCMKVRPLLGNVDRMAIRTVLTIVDWNCRYQLEQIR